MLSEKTKMVLLGVLIGVVSTLVIVNIYDLTSANLQNQPLEQMDDQSILNDDSPDLPNASDEAAPSNVVDPQDMQSF